MALSAEVVTVFVTALVAHVASEVVIFNCCPNGTIVTEDGNCRPFRIPAWAPAVYSPTEKTLYPPGTIPDDWRMQEDTMPRCNPGESPVYFESVFDLSDQPPPPTFFIFDNGSLQLTVAHVDVYPSDPGRYCVNIAGCFVCMPTAEDPNPLPRVKKCCGRRAVFSGKEKSCKVHSQNLNIPNVTFIEGFPTCLEFSISGKLDDTHHLLPDGTLRSGEKIITDFCIEHLFEHPNDGISVFDCPDVTVSPRNDIRFTLYPIGFFISVFFLAVTLVASCLLPSTYHVLHWRCQTNHVACLLVGDLLLGITQISGNALNGPACVAIAISIHFMFLAAFFWLNTMCFNIWWTFRDLRPSNLDKGQEACRLRFYELYAWGGPLVIAGIAAVCDHLPEESYPNMIKPRFGEKRCWFYGDTEIFSYFFGPVAVLLLLNLTLFAATARELTCGLWKTEVVKSNTERATLGRVCLKLVVVMGVTWVADVVSWAVGGPNYLWYLTDLINALQGVLIFAVVGCQPQVWAALRRLWCLRESPSDGHPRSSSSNALPSCGEQNTSTTKGMETLC
ncbi:probable G-protein coupled receptor Mth-like 1 isoform X2 [Homalodisca vitripennis]|uniref:probable G-protein coupled receptor Mth-like 1 isoform X1 n=1 Tax=Homalodisca vitripennis TaxID=197043 RepID=UPI001EEA5AAE|nr:probable G-protein coupled receptor Mth-like 1 isoform X1 [Homalodisca vitripennis]XP_046680869.1 probable G-protein coupled receptor Mth-like 1 isoform X2 [Homalodisca vitripennis]